MTDKHMAMQDSRDSSLIKQKNTIVIKKSFGDKSQAELLVDTVISNNYCIGCGACAAIEGSSFEIDVNEFGCTVAKYRSDRNHLIGEDEVKYLEVCPFSDNSLSEDTLSRLYFPNSKHSNNMLGNFEQCFGGHVVEGDYRARGTSGGIARWIGAKLLDKGMVDHYIQLAPMHSEAVNKQGEKLFDYSLYTSSDQILNGSKAAYYPSTMANILSLVRENPGSYAISALPCNAKAIRLLQQNHSIYAERIKYVVGIICGGMKSANYANFIAMQYPVEVNNVRQIDFRKKNISSPANIQQSEIKFWDKKSNSIAIESKPNKEVVGLDYGMGLFKPKACDYCDDVVGETADISVGDAWLPEFMKDANGDSILIVRNSELESIIEDNRKRDALKVKKLSARDVVASQAAGFRHRREGLAVRLLDQAKANNWAPKKRVLANDAHSVSENRKYLYRLRETISRESHERFLPALEANNFALFSSWLLPVIEEYKKLNKKPFVTKVVRKLTLGRVGSA